MRLLLTEREIRMVTLALEAALDNLRENYNDNPIFNLLNTLEKYKEQLPADKQKGLDNIKAQYEESVKETERLFVSILRKIEYAKQQTDN